MEEPRSEWRHWRTVKIEVNKCASFRTAMLLQKIAEALIAEVMKNARRYENGCGLVETKCIGDFKLATKVLDRRQPLSFVEQRDIEIDTHQLNIVAKRSACSEPTNYEASAAPDIDYADWVFNTAFAQCIQYRFQQLGDAFAMLKLFRHALHLAMRGNQNLIDCCRIQNAVLFRYLLDDPDGFVIAKLSELDQDLCFLDGLAL